jgi:archaemetzincin
VTGKDLFLPIFTFVIGEAYLGGRAAVVSTYRLSEESAGLPPRPRVLKARLLKEAVHELGHCHGLVHCPDWHCVMHASSTAEDVDLKSDEPCDECLQELRGRSVAEPRDQDGR